MATKCLPEALEWIRTEEKLTTKQLSHLSDQIWAYARENRKSLESEMHSKKINGHLSVAVAGVQSRLKIATAQLVTKDVKIKELNAHIYALEHPKKKRKKP